MEKIRHKAGNLFNTVYDIGIIIKGIDGFIELMAGLVLLVAPSVAHTILMFIHNEFAEGPTHHLRQYIAQYVAHVDTNLAKAGMMFLIIFLISHGVVKLALVYALLKKIVQAYPIALVVLGLFLVYQIYAFIREPGIGMGLFIILDAAIIGLVWREYKLLLSENMV